ncbi:hypothetical protein OS493_009393 [Desmophyllum pertusum]|uniref:Uncharacterized protein n=1 Tax=Desmophyllum pertusum TaxID=174260 RepID=A0A9W9Z2V3_9CNID|nr:hypothetical protein OS493_009393 [Desmophyllum pertusum]
MSFITVKFGDNEEELFNPNCVTVNLLDNLRRRCGCQKGSGKELKNLHEFPTQYAHRFLKGREVFVLIKVEKGQGDQPTTYTALLNDLERSNPKLLGKKNAQELTSGKCPHSPGGRYQNPVLIPNPNLETEKSPSGTMSPKFASFEVTCLALDVTEQNLTPPLEGTVKILVPPPPHQEKSRQRKVSKN